MSKLKLFINKLKSYRKSIDGATAVEYGLLVALIAVVCIAAISALGTKMSTQFSSIAVKIGNPAG